MTAALPSALIYKTINPPKPELHIPVGFFTPVYHMKESGWVKISQDDTMALHYQYQAEKMAQQ